MDSFPPEIGSQNGHNVSHHEFSASFRGIQDHFHNMKYNKIRNVKEL